jgi:hypothetical protein
VTITDIQSQHPDVRKRFPAFAAAMLCEFELAAGQMLYLPASWFHEVVSFGAAEASKEGEEGVASGGAAAAGASGKAAKRKTTHGGAGAAAGGAAGAGGAPAPMHTHMALNYWFAPPTRTDFAAPYEDGYWERVYHSLQGAE